MRIRGTDNFRVTFSAVVTGLLLGAALVFLTVFIALLPHFAYLALPVYVLLPALFLFFFIPYVISSTVQCRRKHYAVLYFSGIFSVVFSFITSLTFTFAYPYIHQTLYIALLEFTGMLVNAKRFSMTPAPGHYWFSLASMLPGIILGIILLLIYFGHKRRKEAEYHQPKKKNYYYI